MNRLAWLAVPAALVVYLATMAPVVGLIDSGELAAGCHLLNILHPTGYPLYTALGRLASLVPVGSVVNRVAALSALLGAAGVGLLLLLFRRMKVGAAAAGTTALVLAFSMPVWMVSVDVEVYALTLVLVVLLWLTTERARDGRLLLAAAYFAGLALSNHMSAASAVFGAALAAVLERRPGFWRRLPLATLFFLLGVSPYLFLLLRARAGPLLAWGNPVTFERLWWHVTGKQYQVWMFSLPLAEVAANAGRGLALLARSLGYVLVPAVFYGAWRVYRERRGLAIGLSAAAISCFLYAVNYSIPDIEAYYLPCLVALAVFAARGLDGLVSRVGRWRHLAWLVPAVVFAFNLPLATRRGDFVAHDAARNTLESAEPGAIILTEFWDIYSPAFYLQRVEGLRPDVCIIDKELVRRSWYIAYLERAYPWLADGSRPELDRYLPYLDQFEHGRLKDPAAIQRAFIATLESFVTRHPDRPACTTIPPRQDADAQQMLPGWNWLARGLLFELRTDSVTPPFDYERLTVRLPAHPDGRTRANLARYDAFCRERARLLIALGRRDEAAAVLDWYRRNFPE